ncbi:hypothetical protein AB0E04_03875 [Streptomyces sp. NPDC048251]|uniref:hypothetical protein n=1 Tax=Streptomyces sp. NPDC048251 TaxID=3154501 RepID=UPI003442D1FB
MSDNMRQPVTASAAAHAERIRSGGQRAEVGKPAAGQSTAERIAQRILPGYRADAELREQARMNELRARGVVTPDAEPEDVEDEYDEDQEDEILDEDDEEEAPSTAELYARRERARQKAERAATLAAHRSVGQVAPPPQVHRYAEILAQPYRRTPGGQNPAA